jgi:hypothetical protein
MTIRILLLTFISFTTVADTREVHRACDAHFLESSFEQANKGSGPRINTTDHDLCLEFAREAQDGIYNHLISEHIALSIDAVITLAKCKPHFTRIIKKHSRKHREWSEKTFRMKYGQYEAITGRRLRLPTEQEYDDAFQVASIWAGTDEDIWKSFASGINHVLGSISRNGCKDFGGGLGMGSNQLGHHYFKVNVNTKFCRSIVEQLENPLPRNGRTLTEFETVQRHTCHILSGQMRKRKNDSRTMYREELEKKQLRDSSFPKREPF